MVWEWTLQFLRQTYKRERDNTSDDTYLTHISRIVIDIKN